MFKLDNEQNGRSMKREFLQVLASPCCHADLRLEGETSTDPEEINGGELLCANCEKRFPVVKGIPRFVPESNYADSFGFEWGIYGRVQIDSISGNSISTDRFRATTGWEEGGKEGEWILDAGCGGGRFTEVALRTGANLVSFDYSTAIDSAKESFAGRDENLNLAQVSIYEMPFKPVFDAVYCMGVLQHTPDPRESLQCLCDMVKPGGELVVDVYPKHDPIQTSLFDKARIWVNPQNWLWKPLFKLLPYRWTYQIVRAYVWAFLKLDTQLLAYIRRKRPSAIASLLSFARHCPPIQICNHSLQFPFLSWEYKRLWAEMNTLDIYSPKYTQPQTRATMTAWGEELGLEGLEVFSAGDCGDGALVMRGTKPKDSPPPGTDHLGRSMTTSQSH